VAVLARARLGEAYESLTGLIEAPRSLDQFQPTRDDVRGIAPLDRVDIGRVHHRQPQVGRAIPHRHRCRLDQPRQRLIRLTESRGLGTKSRDFRFAVGRIKGPEEHRPGRPHLARRAPAAKRDRARRALQPHRPHERPPRPLCRGDVGNQPRGIVRRQPRPPGSKLRDRPRWRVEPQPVRHPPRHLDPPARADHRHDRRRPVEDRLQLRVRLDCFNRPGTGTQTDVNQRQSGKD
jgi:hypothetical protein